MRQCDDSESQCQKDIMMRTGTVTTVNWQCTFLASGVLFKMPAVHAIAVLIAKARAASSVITYNTSAGQMKIITMPLIMLTFLGVLVRSVWAQPTNITFDGRTNGKTNEVYHEGKSLEKRTMLYVYQITSEVSSSADAKNSFHQMWGF